MTKIVVDTNCLLDNPELLLDNDKKFAISYITLQELDKLKSNQDLSFPARTSIKLIYELFQQDKIEIINVPTEGITNDEKIVNDCASIDGILMSQDIGALVVAKSKKVETYDLQHVDKEWDRNFKGYIEVTVDDKSYYSLTKNIYQHIEIEDIFMTDSREVPPINSYVVLYPSSIGADKNYLVFRKFEDRYELVPPSTKNLKAAGIGIEWLHPEQLIAFDCVFNSESKLAVITGKIGSSKTLMSMCGALAATCGHKNKKKYDKILVTRPNIPINKQYALGFMKGPQPLWAKILTPTGWTTMGNIKVGDYVIGRAGIPVKVKGVYPQGVKEIYEIKTNTHKTTYACGDHLWYTQNYNEKKHNKKGSIKTTLEIMNTLTYKDTGKLNHYLPINERVEFSKENELPLHPYVLGCLLGNGHIREDGAISIASIDIDIIERINTLIEPISAGILGNSGISYTIGATDNRANKPKLPNGRLYTTYTNPVKAILADLDLLGKKFDTKFIPNIYMYNSSFEDRLELLRGLLDTDGNVQRSRNATFNSSNKNLATQVLELVRSLGGYGYIKTRDRRNSESNFIKEGRNIITKCISYEVSICLGRDINPFYLPRKANKYASKYISNRKDTVRQDRILSITPYKKEEVQCISLDDEEHLYITDDYIVTHNTLEEKMHGWLAPFKTNLQFLYENTLKDRENQEAEKIYSEYFQAMPIESIQGASFHTKILLVDECYSADTEVLTEKGWQRFDSLERDIKVLQYNTENKSTEFVYPTRYIEKDFTGDMINLKSHRGFDFLVTPKHEMLTYQHGEFKKQESDLLKINSSKYFILAGDNHISNNGDNILTPIERLAIATQADGSVKDKKSGSVSLQFSFAKDRKVKRLLDICRDGNFRVTENKKQSKKGNISEQRRFWISLDISMSKNLWDTFSLVDLNRNKAKAIIEEMVEWDGHKNRDSDESYLFTTTQKDQCDFYQAVSHLAGYKTKITKVIDDRKDTYKDVYRLFIIKNTNIVSTQSLNKTYIPYDGKVYCVTVPSGNILVRRNGKVAIAGNCQLLDTNTLRQIMSRVAVGSKLVLILDPSQTYGANRGNEGYKKLLPHCKGNKHISFIELQHIQRSELTKVVDEIFS